MMRPALDMPLPTIAMAALALLLVVVVDGQQVVTGQRFAHLLQPGVSHFVPEFL